MSPEDFPRRFSTAFGAQDVAGLAALIVGQMVAMRVLLRDPKAKAPWYNATGITMYVSGMMIAAFALRTLGA